MIHGVSMVIGKGENGKCMQGSQKSYWKFQ